MLRVYDLTTEHLKNPLGMDAKSPRFSWKMESDRTNVMQESYRVLVSEDKEFTALIYDSGIIESRESQNIRYMGLELESSRRYFWKIQISAAGESAESEISWFEMGLLSKEDWRAKWIEPECEINRNIRKPAPYLRREFPVKKGLARARIYQSARGLYHFWVNGKSGTEDRFNPGFTSYYHRIQYQTYDITALLKEGLNCLGIILADGWWRGTIGGVMTNSFDDKVQYIGQILLEYTDGSSEIIASDEQFLTDFGAYRETDMRAGEVYDANLEQEGWNLPGFDASVWRQVHLVAGEYQNTDLLIPSRSVPVRQMEHFVGSAFRDTRGDMVVDFGQNIAGVVSMRLCGLKKGQQIRIDHGECLKDGHFSIENLMVEGYPEADIFQRVVYTAKGEEVEEYTPLFSIAGFRYIRIRGYDQEVKDGDFTAIAIYSDLGETGKFHCSNPLLNRLFQNTLWSQKGNFLDVPTDCPTRERSPWTGDAQIYGKTAAWMMNVYPFFEKWMQDFTYEQLQNGIVPCTVPNTLSAHHPEEIKRRNALVDRTSPLCTVPGHMYTDPEYGCEYGDGSSGWSNSCVIIPWEMYICYGDKEILKRQYSTAKKWLTYVRNAAKKENPEFIDLPQYHTYTDGERDADYLWDTQFHYGEWLEPDNMFIDDPDFFGKQVKYGCGIVATAYYAHSAGLVAKMAEELGYEEDAKEYIYLSKKVRTMYAKYYIPPNGVIAENRQAANVRALAFGLCAESQKESVAKALVNLIHQKNNHLNTGFLSTKYLLQVLADQNELDLAYELLEQESSPSWLHNVKSGATTILEVWDGFERVMGSYNHYSYGAVCEFLQYYVAGIRPDEKNPGYRHFYLAPRPGGTIISVSSEYESVYGRIVSEWKKEADGMHYHFIIPAGTSATVKLDSNEIFELGSGDYRF